MTDFVISFLGSVAVAALLYLFYWLSFRHCSKGKAYAECWWLPAWNCFRLVIRNEYSDTALFDIKYRAWLKATFPAVPGCSTSSSDETIIISGDRILLPAHNDFVMISFRLEHDGEQLELVHTDKFGRLIAIHKLSPEIDSLRVEYQLKVRSWFLFKHEIVRRFEIPRYVGIKGKRVNLFQDYILNIQQQQEQLLPFVFLKSEVITVAV